MKGMPRWCLLIAALILMAGPAMAASAPTVDHATDYDACLALTETDPAGAYAAGLALLKTGGGIPARHCLAVAMVGLKDYESAATRFETLAREIDTARTDLRAQMLGQAGQAWLLAGRPVRATEVQGAAIALSPDDPAFYVDRATSLITRQRYDAALVDLNAALSRAPGFADAYLYRASTRRYLDDLLGARADVERTLSLVPGLPAAILERGILRQFDGDLGGARRDWLRVIEAAPDSAEADAARARIEEMDVMR